MEGIELGKSTELKIKAIVVLRSVFIIWKTKKASFAEEAKNVRLKLLFDLSEQNYTTQLAHGNELINISVAGTNYTITYQTSFFYRIYHFLLFTLPSAKFLVGLQMIVCGKNPYLNGD